MKILLVEDNKEIASTITEKLRPHYLIDCVHNGIDAEYLAIDTDYDIIILDINLPDKSGIEVCSYLRTSKVSTPIIMLTGRIDVSEKVLALDQGADDYLTKPFNFPELFARIRALSRRKKIPFTKTTFNIHDLSIDIAKKSVSRGNKHITLRRKEFDLLEYMIRNSGKVVTREMILDHVWNNNTDLFTNTVDVHIKYLRDRVDKPFYKKLIKTIYGVGYRIE